MNYLVCWEDERCREPFKCLETFQQALDYVEERKDWAKGQGWGKASIYGYDPLNVWMILKTVRLADE